MVRTRLVLIHGITILHAPVQLGELWRGEWRAAVRKGVFVDWSVGWSVGRTQTVFTKVVKTIHIGKQ